MGQVGRLGTGLALLTLLVVSACEIKPPTSAIRPVRAGEDDWKRSAYWLFATEGSASGHGEECAAVYEWLQQERRCQGALCRQGADLASEWVQKCPEHASARADAVRSLETELATRAKSAPSACATQFDQLLKPKCKPAACVEAAQRWATECGETECGPLGVRLVEQALRRVTAGETHRLDTRSCVSLRQAVREAAACADQTACKEVLPVTQAFRDKCLSEERKPDLATAVELLAVAVVAGGDAEPIAVSASADQLDADAVPLVLADGSGAVLGLCHQRPRDLAAYQALRQRCAGTTLSVARLFFGKQGQRTMRVGRFIVPESFEPPTPYPWLNVRGEAEQLAERKAAAFGTALDGLPAAADAGAVAALVKVVGEYALWLENSHQVRAELTARDAKLAPLLEKLAQAKVAAARPTLHRLALYGLHHRALTRPFADVELSGTVQSGAATPAYWLRTASMLPTATAAYRRALEPMKRRLPFGARLLPMEETQLAERAREQARICAAAQAEQADLERQLSECLFPSCDDTRHGALYQQWATARAKAEQARREVDFALAPTGSGAAEWPGASEAGCEATRW